MQIDYLRQRLQEREIGFEISEQTLDLLGEAGFDPVYGARPMKRAIQQQLENPLAQQILAGNFVAGDTINVDVEHQTLRFVKGLLGGLGDEKMSSSSIAFSNRLKWIGASCPDPLEKKHLITEVFNMKKQFFVLLFIFSLSGCAFQKPDYLKVISPAELNQVMQHQDIFLVDVHTPEQKHIKGTDLFIPYNEIEKYKDKLPKDKNTAIYLYCEGGPMGNAAARSLHELGYDNLTNLEGGAKAWGKAGLGFE